MVYRLRCEANGKLYFGVTTDLHKRMRGHLKASCCRKIYRAICKHGPGAFTVEVVGDHPDAEAAYTEEIAMIAKHDTTVTGYNIAVGGKGGGVGRQVQTRLVGRRFGSLSVVADSGTRDQFTGQVRWRCACDCGQEVTRTGPLLVRSRAAFGPSCGCRSASRLRPGAITHGAAGTREFSAWVVARRHSKKSGLGICPQWARSFPAFLRDMGGCPTGHVLGRRDPFRGYFRRNCAWMTRGGSSERTAKTRLLSAFGEERSMASWARDPRVAALGISYTLLRARINMLGWNATRALTTQPNQRA